MCTSLLELLCRAALLALSSADVAISLTSKGNASQAQHLGPPHPCNMSGLRQETKPLKAVCRAQVKRKWVAVSLGV